MKNKILKTKVAEKRFIVRKYVMAISVKEALQKERRTAPDDVFVDDDWKKENPNKLESDMGFQINKKRVQ